MDGNKDVQAGVLAMLARSAGEDSLPGNVFSEKCPSREVLKHVTSRWGVLILIVLRGGTHRFSDLRRKIGGMSERMLAQTLQWLERDGLVLRKAYPVVPPHVEYSLTHLGVDIAHKVADLGSWIEANIATILAEQEKHDQAAR